MELLRSDEKSFSGTGLTISQCVSVCVLTLGLIGIQKVLERQGVLPENRKS